MAASAEETQGLHLRHVGTVAKDIITLTLDDGREAVYGSAIPYVRQEGDTVEAPDHHRWVRRDGQRIGSLVGPEGKLLGTYSKIPGEPVDITPADKTTAWRVTSPDDPAFSDGVSPTAVYRKSKPTDMMRVKKGHGLTDRHILYLKLPSALTPGKQYRLSVKGVPLDTVQFIWNPMAQRSEAVHVSQVGFRPDDPAKVAFLSCWMGTGGGMDYGPTPVFKIVRVVNNTTVFEGVAVLSRAGTEPEDKLNRNYNNTDVYMLDFSEFTAVGEYRVYVEGVGCSYSFEIADDVWRKAFYVSARGLYHHRSGIALEAPYTDWERPRCFHPDDGVKVYHSTAALMDTGNGLNRLDDGNFGNLNAGRTDQIVENAWGSYMDAGDWDRRIQHLDASRLLLELADVAPEYFADLSLNIPESGDGLPDIVSESLFNLDGYRRMQTPEGGIRGGIESSEHPGHGEGSWQESLVVMAYAPGVWSSHVYAGVAARAASWLDSRAPEKARVYRESALAAMAWAEKHYPDLPEDHPRAVDDARNLAAAELFRLTGDQAWHDLFLKTTVYEDSEKPSERSNQQDAAWVYSRTDHPKVDKAIQANCRNAVLREADTRVGQGEQTAFRWTKNPNRTIGWGPLGAPDAISVVRAHVLTGEEKYLRALVLACQLGAGANPSNVCYTTGVGHDWPRKLLHEDARKLHREAPFGITIYGPMDNTRMGAQWSDPQIDQHCMPPMKDWPTTEALWDVFWYAPVVEYTIMQTIGPNAYVWGYLAAR
jgi:endoglucanase